MSEFYENIEEALLILKKTLAPLSDDESKAIEAALAPSDTPPAAFNEDDVNFLAAPITKNDNIAGREEKEAEVEVEVEVETAEIINVNKSNTFNGLVFETLNCDGQPTDNDELLKAMDARRFDASSLKAANDIECLGEAFSTFESSFLDSILNEHCLKIERSEKGGKTFYLFETNANRSTALVVVFDVKGKKMVNISDVILPLDTFLSLEKCLTIDLNEGNEETRLNPTLRNFIRNEFCIECTFKNCLVIKIQNIDVSLLMAIVSHLSSVYNVDKSDECEDSVEQEEDEEEEQQQQQQRTPFLSESLKANVINMLVGAVVSGLSIWFGTTLNRV